MIDRAWNRKFRSHFRLIEIFGLTNDYLPEEIEKKKKYSNFWKDQVKKSQKNFFSKLIYKIFRFIKSFFTTRQKEKYGLLDFQIRIKEQLLSFIENKKLKTIVHMPTGSWQNKNYNCIILFDFNSKSDFLKNNFLIWLALCDELVIKLKTRLKTCGDYMDLIKYR